PSRRWELRHAVADARSAGKHAILMRSKSGDSTHLVAIPNHARALPAPVHAVRGNVDHGAWSANLPVTQRIEIDGFRIYVLHILAELDPQAADNVDVVIYGNAGGGYHALLAGMERISVDLGQFVLTGEPV